MFLMVSNFIKRLADFFGLASLFYANFVLYTVCGLHVRRVDESQGSEERAGCPAEEEAWRALKEQLC